ncbi:MAG: dTDP-4-dehydrorhamnose 3,5-epimerase family protein [Puniceicoccaceae bacterium]
MNDSDTKRSRLAGGGSINGVTFKTLQMNKDERGCFTEVFQEYWGTCLQPVQWSVVHSRKGVLRGPHLHKNHDEYIGVISGMISVGLRDMRPGSPTEGVWSLYELVDVEMACLVFPSGLLHGWYFPVETIHLQGVSESHRDYGESDNLGCKWDDPELDIPWPTAAPIISERAMSFPSYRELVESLQGWTPEPVRD